MSYGNWKGVFSFQNSIFNSIFVIKHTLGDPLVLSSQIFLFSPSGHFLSLSLSLSLSVILQSKISPTPTHMMDNSHADPRWPISLCPSSFPRRSEISDLTRSCFVVDPKEKKKGSTKWFFLCLRLSLIRLCDGLACGLTGLKCERKGIGYWCCGWCSEVGVKVWAFCEWR